MKVFTLVSSMLYASFSLAGDMGAHWQPVITLSGGPAWSNPGKTQTVPLSPTFSQLYVASSHPAAIASGELFLGGQHACMRSLVGQLGLAVATTTHIPLKGEIWQDSDPDFNNFNYQYYISHTHVAIRGKLFLDNFQLVQPYVSASLGVGFNHAYHYTDEPRLVEVAPEPPFGPRTITAFTYTLDAGVQKPLNKNWTVGVGYELTDWGKAQLGTASNQTLGAGPLLNHIYVNQLLFSLSFLA